MMMNDTKEQNNGGKRKSKYVDDITLCMAWQNYQLLNYSWSVYCYSSYIQTLNSIQLPISSPSFHVNYAGSQWNQQQQHQPQPQQPARRNNIQEYRVAKLASIQRRLVAEAIDFIILAVAKALTILYLYGNDYIEHFEFLIINDNNINNINLNNLEWMLVQAIIYRLLVIAYEGYMLSGTLPFSTGQTIGKKLMGIKVIHSDIVTSQGENIHCYLNPVGVLRSCIRSFFKNMAISLLFPLLLPILVFNHNRLVYDLLVDTIVIEVEPPLVE